MVVTLTALGLAIWAVLVTFCGLALVAGLARCTE